MLSSDQQLVELCAVLGYGELVTRLRIGQAGDNGEHHHNGQRSDQVADAAELVGNIECVVAVMRPFYAGAT